MMEKGQPALLHQLFERLAVEWPERTALVCGDHRLSYEALNRQADAFARRLRCQGLKRGDAVAILLPRAMEMYAVLLGILKAGAAYVPLDPEYPAERVRYILADCSATALVTSDSLCAAAGGFNGPMIKLNQNAPGQFFRIDEAPAQLESKLL